MPPETQPAPIALDPKKVAEIERLVPTIAVQAQDLTIENHEDYAASTVLLDRIVSAEKMITAFFEEPVKHANALHKWLTGQRSRSLQPLEQAEMLQKKRRQEFRAEEERKRVAKEQEEREAAKAEAERIALQEAAKFHDMGEPEAAETILERAALAPPPPVIVPSTIPKEHGHSIRKVYKYRVTNPALHKREFLVLDESRVQAIVSKLGPDANMIVGGIEVYQEELETIRRKQ